MFLHEPIYDLDELAHSNLHVHTKYSRCADSEMKISAIIKQAEKCGLETIAITNHVHVNENLQRHIKRNEKLRRQVEKSGTKINVLIGGEYSAYGIGKYTLKDSEYKPDYRLYSANHYHVDGWEQPEEKSPDGYKEHAKLVLKTLFDDNAADCIAHPLFGRFSAKFLDEKYGNDVPLIGKAWSDNELGDILMQGYQSGCAWELNVGAVLDDADFFRRMYNIGREEGIVFNLGTDAHKLCNIDTRLHIDELKRILL